MQKKYTVTSPANIAFIKYWGRSDHKLFIPANSNISMNLSSCFTVTTACLTNKKEDEVFVKFHNTGFRRLSPQDHKSKALFAQIKRIRKFAKTNKKVKIYSQNNFPADAGIASSASSFSALTGVLLLAYGLKNLFEDKLEFSKQIRLCGSGSAVRSCMDGFVEFKTGKDHDSSFAVQIADNNHWDLIDIVVIVNDEKKKVSSSEGHELAETSSFFRQRIKDIPKRMADCKKAILDKDLKKLGEITEEDCLSMISVMLTSKPPILYWNEGSISLINSVYSWRENDKLPVYFSFDAGANAHLITEKKYQKKVLNKLKTNPFVKSTIINYVDKGTRITNKHLF